MNTFDIVAMVICLTSLITSLAALIAVRLYAANLKKELTEDMNHNSKRLDDVYELNMKVLQHADEVIEKNIACDAAVSCLRSEVEELKENINYEAETDDGR